MVKVSRRDFLKISGATATAFAVSNLGFDLKATAAQVKELRIKDIKPVPTICCFCGVGCGALCYVAGGKLINIEGDPDNPNNQGSMCAKGSSLFQLYDNEKRVKKPMYRAPKSDKWEEKEWDWVLDRIAEKVKATRDASFIKTQMIKAKDPATGQEIEKEVVVNRTEAIASLGGAALNNEEAYLQSKMMRGLGVVFLEHQASICHSATVAGLGPSFGRGAMTNHWVDLKNTDCALVMGSNPAENQPVSFKWFLKAREQRGAKLIVVDPRFTLSANQADIYAPLRQGTDIAFLGGMINYILNNSKYWHDYVANYTNAAFLINEEFDFNDGLFTGYNEQDRAYDTTTWDYQVDKKGKPITDLTLQNPRCVLQLMKKHYSRYDLDTVSRITGTKKEDLLKVYETFADTGQPNKSGAIVYATGTTQHTVGSQNVRAFSIVQLLLGNIGFPGGGVQAVRGEANGQGSTDMALLSQYVPGYLSSPSTDWPDLKTYLEKETPKSGDWSNKPKFFKSQLKAWWGAAATKDNDFAYNYLPKRDAGRNYSHIALFDEMHGQEGKGGSVKGLFIFSSNPAVGGPNANKERAVLANLEWMAVVDLWETETAAFWQKDAGADPGKINTEVFMLPSCGPYEKEGTVANSGRWIQYRWKAVEPYAQSKPDLWIIDQVMSRVKKLYADSADPKDRPILDLTWDYGHGHEPEIDLIVKEMNGYEVASGKPLPDFGALKDDGTTACGLWIWGGIYPEEGKYLAKRRDTTDASGIGSYLNWSFAWPANRRIVYNRCSADLKGRPWSEDKKVIWWDSTKGDAAKGEKGKWVGLDVPDFVVAKTPSALGGNQPYIMKAEGVANLFATKAQMKEGPFPEHYEPWESPVNNMLSKVEFNPTIKVWEPDKRGNVKDFPYIGTTFSVAAHGQAGVTRNLPWLAQLTPEVYAELSDSLAKDRGIANGDEILIRTMRGEMRAFALVTKRVKPFDINGKRIEQVGVIWHFGYKGEVTGDSANKLTAHIGDANTMIPEYKAWLCDVRRAR